MHGAMHPALRIALRLAACAWWLALLALLLAVVPMAGCGGSDEPLDLPAHITPPVDCRLHPEQCI